MSLAIHTCCGPCLLYPASVLASSSIDFTCYFFNPNIHPFKEYTKRRETFRELAEQRRFKYYIDDSYGLKEFLRQVVFREQQRCLYCYRVRIKKTCSFALRHDIEFISTTLLYSVYQNHEAICNEAHYQSSLSGIKFYYRDFRLGWQQGVDESRRLLMYRQPYCGCIFSEQERYDPNIRMKKQKGLS